MSNKEEFSDNNTDNNADQSAIENESTEDGSLTQTPEDSRKKINTYQILRILWFIGFIIFFGLFINEVLIQPYRMNKTVALTRELYAIPSTTPTQSPVVTDTPGNTTATPTLDPTRDEQGRLLTFGELLEKNADTKGWLTIPDTNIDYIVMQNREDPIYYLTRDFNGETQKAGCLFLDVNSSVENNTTNLVIHGHNMKSTDNMFHYLVYFKKLDYLKEHPTFTFDTIYQTGQWKIFSVFITNGSDKKEPFFNYTQASFKDSSEYLNFLYQLRIRSLYNIDPVDINENDQIITLSTCSYEIYDYRTVIVARKVRPGEDLTVDVDRIEKNPKPLYPATYYKNYGKEAPDLPATFEEALDLGMINWYKQVDSEQ
ncbi:MAG: class B sortase [Herbinix sp.]|nr:class B sortase [Herbinix sp.]